MNMKFRIKKILNKMANINVMVKCNFLAINELLEKLQKIKLICTYINMYV